MIDIDIVHDSVLVSKQCAGRYRAYSDPSGWCVHVCLGLPCGPFQWLGNPEMTDHSAFVRSNPTSDLAVWPKDHRRLSRRTKERTASDLSVSVLRHLWRVAGKRCTSLLKPYWWSASSFFSRVMVKVHVSRPWGSQLDFRGNLHSNVDPETLFFAYLQYVFYRNNLVLYRSN